MEWFQLNFPIVSWLKASTEKSEACKYIHLFSEGTYPFMLCLMSFGYFFKMKSILKNKQKMEYMEWLLHSSNFIPLLFNANCLGYSYF